MIPNGKIWRDEAGYPHRDGGPAIEWANGDIEWYFHGAHHRIDGPAVTMGTGDQYWWRYGKRHREDGPAVEWTDGRKRWYLYGIEYDSLSWLLKLYELGLK